MVAIEQRLITIGIDPGLSGAIATFDGNIPKVYDIPTITIIKKTSKGKTTKRLLDRMRVLTLLQELASQNGQIKACIEKQIPRPEHGGRKTGGTSTANVMFNYGILLTAMDAVGISYEEHLPIKWQKHFNIGKDTKGDSCRIAKQLYPGLEVYTPKGAAIDGRADAILIATYYRRLINSIE